MAPRRDSAPAANADPEPNALPTFNGSQLELLKWLRNLSNCQHLFEADLAYFLVTGCSVTSSGKTAVVSPEHSVLLNNDIIRQQEFSVMKPPPVHDRFKSLYTLVRQSVTAGAGAPFSTASVTTFPTIAPSQLPDNHILSPDRIILLDLKLRNVLISLIRNLPQLAERGIIKTLPNLAASFSSSLLRMRRPHPATLYRVRKLKS